MILNQKKWQRAFHCAIYTLDYDLMMIALKNGAQINNRQCRKNTLNCVIAKMLSCPTKKFNLKFIEDLVDAGAEIYNNERFSTISPVIEYAIYQKNKAENNVLELINL